MATDPIVTTTDLTAYQGGDAQSLIDQATALVRRYCGWHVTPSMSETITLDGSGVGMQILPSLHVTGITSVTYDGTLLSATDYAWSPNGVIEYVAAGLYFAGVSRWSTGLGKVVVVFTHGYTDAPDLAGVILARATRAQKDPKGNLSSWTRGPFSENYQGASSEFTKDERDTLDRYRLAPRP